MGLPASIHGVVEQLRGTPAEPATALARWAWLFYVELRQDLAFVRAAGLAYATVVAIVPTLVLIIGFAQPLGLFGEHPGETLETLLAPVFGDVPDAGHFVVDGLLRVDLRALGVIATLGLLVVAARMYLSVELAYHDILGVPIRRSLPYRLLAFWFAITVVPLTLILAIRAGFDGTMPRAAGDLTLPIVSRFLVFALLLGALKLLPSVPVRWGPATAGALVSFLGIEVGRRAFSMYVSLFGGDPLMAVYGTIGLFPVFLLWIYLFWVCVLLGVEVANVMQNHTTLSQAEFEADETSRFPSVELAVQVATWVAWHFKAGKGPASLDLLTEVTRLPARHLRAVLAILERGGVLVGSDLGWLLCREAEAIPVAEVVHVWRHYAQPSAEGLDRVQEEIGRRLMSIDGSLADAARRWIDPRRPA
jgi:membrane protein